MALIREYEIPGTGVTVPEAYFVITDVKVRKRVADINPPVDSSMPSGYSERDDTDESLWVHWKAGYVAEIQLTIWASRQAREDNKSAIGFAGVSAAEVEQDLRIGTDGLDQRCTFMYDPSSTENELAQGYNHLKTLDYFAEATED